MRQRRSRGDPWVDFRAEARDDPSAAFYFERGASPGRAGGWATFGVGSERSLTLTRPRDVREMEESVRGLKGPSSRLLVGYLGFDAVGLLEPLLLRGTPSGSPFPPGRFEWFPRATRRRIPRTKGLPAPSDGGPLLVGPPRDQTTPERFQRSVERLQEAIRAGEAFQVVLAHRRERHMEGNLLPLVDRLRRRERYAYLYYLRLGDRGEWELAGASPESVVEISGGHVAISPIAGTRPRPPPRYGPDARLPLARDPKELAEHRMLVDLARNDVGRVATPGSVRLNRRETRVLYSRLEHLVSRVVGHLASGQNAWTALEAAFPAGTVSGAPKIRATELLRAEEGTWRGPYAGAVGFFRGPLDAEFALAIRGAFATGGRVYTEAGAGIVHQSRPVREWQETLTKLSAVERALEGP